MRSDSLSRWCYSRGSEIFVPLQSLRKQQREGLFLFTQLFLPRKEPAQRLERKAPHLDLVLVLLNAFLLLLTPRPFGLMKISQEAHLPISSLLLSFGYLYQHWRAAYPELLVKSCCFGQLSLLRRWPGWRWLPAWPHLRLLVGLRWDCPNILSEEVGLSWINFEFICHFVLIRLLSPINW